MNESAHIVIAEDEEHVALLVGSLLRHAGYRITRYADGQQVINAIANHPAPSLIIMDMMLPFYDGLQLTRAIRQSGPWGEVPILVLADKAQERELNQARAQGINSYLTKPFQPQELLAHIETLISLPKAS